MMREQLIFTTVFLFLLFTGCDTTTPQLPQVITTIECTDLNGNMKSEFLVGEEFLIRFTIINNSGKDLIYNYTLPLSNIYLKNNDSIVSQQYPQLPIERVFINDTLKKNSSIVNIWRAPSPPLSSTIVYLRPGTYTASVFLNIYFTNANIDFYIPSTTFTIKSSFTVRKPNIYLYPPTTDTLLINIRFPSGGHIIQSEPEYGTGWNVIVEPSGLINGTYSYLFYEGETPDLAQYEWGWCVAKDTLTSFFRNNLASAGFIEKEIKDFLDYWIPLLKDSPFYIIYPQNNADINKMIQLSISKNPTTLIRLFYVIKKTSKPSFIAPPHRTEPIQRRGFVVAEWGVYLMSKH